jgi:membrane peptidoglycan carboxypeptidase
MNTTTWKEELQLFENEVEYRLAKWILAGMLQDGIISNNEMQKVWEKIAEHYNPPFLEVDVVGGTIGDGVTVDGR